MSLSSLLELGTGGIAGGRSPSLPKSCLSIDVLYLTSGGGLVIVRWKCCKRFGDRLYTLRAVLTVCSKSLIVCVHVEVSFLNHNLRHDLLTENKLSILHY